MEHFSGVIYVDMWISRRAVCTDYRTKRSPRILHEPFVEIRNLPSHRQLVQIAHRNRKTALYLKLGGDLKLGLRYWNPHQQTWSTTSICRLVGNDLVPSPLGPFLAV
ncbi:hypothetical protein RRG08_057070 [Elysia crispata]|uniref:Uncharacterized protein n=1 Tax=Elysia crispata TaxID=231223 RepID=A0AAE1ALM8_9GAST|nr:hypothetical protein RRG08_057070 [Elysia crispata]